MDDPNKRKWQPIKEIPMSPSSEETCSSTVGTSSQHPDNTVDTDRSSGEARTIMRRQVLHLGLASSGVMSAFIVSVVPANIIIGVAVVFLLWVTFIYRAFQMMQYEYRRALQGRGLGDLLPESWYNQLVNVSFHEFMTDTTFVQENQHFMLYFIPGISREQLGDYVDRLVPRHRRALHRPGIGNFLGNGFMRNVIGDQGLAERQGGTTRRLVPRRLELALPASNEDAASRLGDDDEEDARLWRAEPSIVEEEEASLEAVIEADPSLEISHDGSESEESEEDLAVEEDLVFDAAVSGVMAFAGLAFDYSRREVGGSIVRTAGTALRATLGIGAVSVGAGIFGLWAGFWTPQDLRTFRDTRFPGQMSREASTILMSSTLASGATAGLFMLFGLRSTPNPPSGKPQSKPHKVDPSTTNKKKP
jgi:uncharacterized membrane protein